MGLLDSCKSFKIGLTVQTKYRRVIGRQTASKTDTRRQQRPHLRIRRAGKNCVISQPSSTSLAYRCQRIPQL